MTSTESPFDPRFDLVLERDIDVPRERVWAAWTDPERLKKWFTPAPWQTVDCQIDLRPGGIFRTVMRSPEGEDQAPIVGCYLEIVENEKLVWTTVLGPGFRPANLTPSADCHSLAFTAVLTLQPRGNGTRYRVVAMHINEASSRHHDELGFQDGWGAALDQLVALCRN
jgi:uncharacterized protein YndB with AHSA1/START domain